MLPFYCNHLWKKPLSESLYKTFKMKHFLITFSLILISLFAFAKIKKPIYRIIYIDRKKENCNKLNNETCFRYTFSKKYPYRTLITKSFHFNFEEGYEYKIKVKVLKPASESTKYQEDYQFVQILSKTKKELDSPKNESGLSISNQWILSSFPKDVLYNKPIEKNSYFTISQNKKEINGNTGCNSFGGAVFISGNKILFSNLYQTEKYCAEIDAQEQLFMQQLMKANQFRIQGAELMLYDKEKLLMTLESYR